jgi:lipopolysaccharide transport system ATP-binding protein
MLATVIRIENVGKRYMISHQGSRGNNTLRDAISSGVRSLGSRVLPSNRNIDLDTRREEFWALQGVSLDVERGQVVGIIGRNGAGKSTLLKVLSRITEPTTGRIAIQGRVASLLEVGTGFHSELTGRENIFFNGSVLGMRKAEIKRKFDEIVAFSEAEKFLDTPVKRYSSGMYVRLAFAVAAHLEPDILIIDEVLAVGDAAFQKKCLGRIGDIASKEGRTILFVSHNMGSIQSLCDKTIWLNAGNVMENGATQQTVQRYLQFSTPEEGSSLDRRQDRTGTGEVRITSVRVESVDSGKVIYSGSRLKITIGYRSNKEILFPSFWIDIFDYTSNSGLFRMTSQWTESLPDSLPPEGYVTCVTEPIRLTPGRCHLSLCVKKGSGTADYIRYAAVFNVEDDNFEGSGNVPSRNWMLTVIRQQWNVGTGETT